MEKPDNLNHSSRFSVRIKSAARPATGRRSHARATDMKDETRSRFYAGRDKALKNLGFASYRDYLNSDLWHSIRESVLQRDNHLCVPCGKKATQVHHMRYTHSVLKGLDLGGLISICGGCHVSAEFHYDQKNSLSKANGKIKRKLRRRANRECWKDPQYRELAAQKKAALKAKNRPKLLEIRGLMRGFINAKIDELRPANSRCLTTSKRHRKQRAMQKAV